MERLTNDAINNLLAMSKYDYHMYGLDIKTALSELKEYRTTGLTREEVAALKAENERLPAELEKAWKQIHDDITIMQELQARVEQLEAENDKLRNDLWMVREIGLKS